MSDFAVGSVDWDLYLRTVLFVSDNFLNVDTPSSSVNGKDLADLSFNTVLSRAGFNVYSVSHSDWNRSAIVFSAKLFAQAAAHHLSSDAAWSGEVSLSRLSSLTGNTWSNIIRVCST